MTALRKENWINYLSELPTNQTQNEHMADILNLVPYHQGAKTILEKIQKNPGLTLLLVDGFSELVLLHHLDCLPANVFRTEDRLVALNGYTSKADCFRIDPETAFRDLEFQTPVWRDLKSVGTKDAVQNLQAPDQASTSFKGKQVMIVPPLVSLAILEAKTVQPGELIPIHSKSMYCPPTGSRIPLGSSPQESSVNSNRPGHQFRYSSLGIQVAHDLH